MSLNLQQFYNTLTSDDFHIPVEANFIIEIENLFTSSNGNSILNKLQNKSSELNPGNNKIRTVVGNVWSESLYKDTTLFFANGVTIPGETSTSGRVGMSANSSLHGGLLSAPILKGRKDFTDLSINFFETNLSFIDSVLRPWTVAVSQYGLFARNTSSNQNFKTNIIIYFLSKTGASTGSDGVDIRKKITFKDAAPVSVGDYEVTYASTGKSVDLRTAKTTWTYTTYETDYPNMNANANAAATVAPAGN